MPMNVILGYTALLGDGIYGPVRTRCPIADRKGMRIRVEGPAEPVALHTARYACGPDAGAGY
jgi:hypothetical protein